MTILPVACFSVRKDSMACVEEYRICEDFRTGELTQLLRDPKNNCKYPSCPPGSAEVQEDVDPYDNPTTTTPTTSSATTPSPATSSAAGAPTGTTKTPSPTIVDESALVTTKWINIDSNHSGSLTKATYRAFAAYNRTNVCDELHVAAVSYEKMVGTIPSAPQVYSIVAQVTCKLESEQRVAGKYVLHFEESPANHFELTMCGHTQDGTIINWIAVDNGVTVCQTPTEKDVFESQAVEHVDHKASTGLSDFVNKLKAGDTRALAVTGVGIVACLLIVLVVVVYRSRRLRRYQATETASGTPTNKIGEEMEDESKEDEETTIEESSKDEVEEDEPSTTTGLRADMKVAADKVDEAAEAGKFMNSPSLRHQV
ncbi:unnamed protein product [Aphanomyces euteiches]